MTMTPSPLPPQYTRANGPINVFKLTNKYGETRNETFWNTNTTHLAPGNSNHLGNDKWLHFYTDPLIAALLHPAHVGFQNPILWTAKAEGKILLDQDTKGGCTKLTTQKITELPNLSRTQRVDFAATLIAQAIDSPTTDPYWTKWTNLLLASKPTDTAELNDLIVKMAHKGNRPPCPEIIQPLFYEYPYQKTFDAACALSTIRAFRVVHQNTKALLGHLAHNFFQTDAKTLG